MLIEAWSELSVFPFLESDVEVSNFHLDSPRFPPSCFRPAEDTLSLVSSLWRLEIDLESPAESTESVKEDGVWWVSSECPEGESKDVENFLKVLLLKEEEDELVLRKGDVYPEGDAEEELVSVLVLREEESVDSGLKAEEEEERGGRDLAERSVCLLVVVVVVVVVVVLLSVILPVVVLSRVLMVGKDGVV